MAGILEDAFSKVTSGIKNWFVNPGETYLNLEGGVPGVQTAKESIAFNFIAPILIIGLVVLFFYVLFNRAIAKVI